MKTISLLCCKRPQYLRQTLEFLKRNKTSGWTLVPTVDKDTCNERVEVTQIIRGINWIDTRPRFTKHKLGSDRASHVCITRAFEIGSEYNLYLEEDVELSMDALSMVDWAMSNQRITRDGSVGIALMREESDLHEPTIIANDAVGDGMISWGFACTANQWNSFYCKSWNHYENYHKSIGWDWSVGYSIIDKHMEIWRPRANRSRHFGVVGVNSFNNGELPGSSPCWNGEEVEYKIEEFR